MSTTGGPNIVRDGLIVLYDPINSKLTNGTNTLYNGISDSSILNSALYGAAGYSYLDDGKVFVSGTGGNLATGGYIRGSGDLSTGTNSNFTTSCWINRHTSTKATVCEYRGGSFRLEFCVNDSSMYFNQRATITPYSTNSTSVSVSNSLNTWDYYALSKSGNSWSFYKNAELIGTNTFSMTETINAGSYFYIGITWSDDDYLSNGMTGWISMFTHYNRALSIDEIQQNYDSQKSRYITPTKLVWSLDSTGSIYSINRVTPTETTSGCNAILYSELPENWSKVIFTSINRRWVRWAFNRADNSTNLPLILQCFLGGGNPGSYLTINVGYNMTLDLTKSSAPNGGSNPYIFMHNNNGAEVGDVPTFGNSGGHVWGTGMYWGQIDDYTNYGGLMNNTVAHVGSAAGSTTDRLLIYVE